MVVILPFGIHRHQDRQYRILLPQTGTLLQHLSNSYDERALHWTTGNKFRPLSIPISLHAMKASLIYDLVHRQDMSSPQMVTLPQ
jgi:hypothetical protein